MTSPADWQLPPGVSRGVWDYLHDSSVADEYDESLRGTPLLVRDLEFVAEHVPRAGLVLDLGCGTGRAAIALAGRGYSVIGVDFSAEMLRVCGQRARAAAVAVHRIQANIVGFNAIRESSCDAALCLFSTLGMVATSDDRTATVRAAFRALRPGGTFIVHGHNRWHHLRTSVGRRWLLRDVVRSLFRAPSAGDWPMPHAPGRSGWTMHLFTRRELARLLTDAGFRIACTEPIGQQPAYGFLVAARKPP